MLKSKDFFLVNVLPAYEGEIPQTDAFISYLDTAARLDLYPSVKSSAIVLYCRTGRSAAIAQRDLIAAGYTDVRVLAGGLRGAGDYFPTNNLPKRFATASAGSRGTSTPRVPAGMPTAWTVRGRRLPNCGR